MPKNKHVQQNNVTKSYIYIIYKKQVKIYLLKVKWKSKKGSKWMERFNNENNIKGKIFNRQM